MNGLIYNWYELFRTLNDADLQSLQVAREVLLDEKFDIIGLDLEHIPDNVQGLLNMDKEKKGNGPNTQTLQIACREGSFVIDLQTFDEGRQASRKQMQEQSRKQKEGGGENTLIGLGESEAKFYTDVEDMLAELFEDEERVKVPWDEVNILFSATI